MTKVLYMNSRRYMCRYSTNAQRHVNTTRMSGGEILTGFRDQIVIQQMHHSHFNVNHKKRILL